MAPFALVPRYFVALTGGNTLPDQGRRAVVAATATGALLGSVTPPPPYRLFTWVAAAGNDRTFVLAAQRAEPVAGAAGHARGDRPGQALRAGTAPVRSAGRAATAAAAAGQREHQRLRAVPRRQRAGGLHNEAPGAAARTSQIQVLTLATGAQRTWTWSGAGWVGQDKPNAQSLVWAGDDRTLLFKQYLGEGGARAQIRLLDTAAPGGSLTAASTRVPFPSALISGRAEDPVQDYGNMLLTARRPQNHQRGGHAHLAWPEGLHPFGLLREHRPQHAPAAVPWHRPPRGQANPLLHQPPEAP